MKTLTFLKNKITLLIFLLMMVVSIGALSACSLNSVQNFEMFQNAVYSHLIIKEGNQTVENFRLNYSQTTWDSQEDKQTFVEDITVFFEDFSNMLDTHYKTLLTASESFDLALPQKFTSISNENDNIIVVAKFPNNEIWKEVSVKNGLYASTTSEINLLSYTVFDTVEKLGSVINVGGMDAFVGDYIFEEVFDFLTDNNFANVIDSSQTKNVFAYATESRRLKSDAESFGVLEGKHFHFWNFTDDEITNIMFSFTYARVQAWYILAMSLGFFVVSVMFFISYLKKETIQTLALNNISTSLKKIKAEIEKSDQGLDFKKDENLKDKQTKEKTLSKIKTDNAKKENLKKGKVKKETTKKDE